MSAMERTELKMAVIAEQLGLSWAGEWNMGWVQKQALCEPTMFILCLTSLPGTVLLFQQSYNIGNQPMNLIMFCFPAESHS